MKIVYLNPGGAVGGAEMCLIDILSALRSARPDIQATVILGDEGPLRTQIEALGIRCDVLVMPASLANLGDAGAGGFRGKLSLAVRGVLAAPEILAYARKLRRRLRKSRPDLIHSNGMKMHLLGAWTAPRDVPVVWHLHDYLGSRPAMARLLRRAARPGVEAVAVSNSVAEDARATLQGRIPIRAIHNFVDIDRFHPGTGDVSALDLAAGLPPAAEGTARVGLVATYANWKGHDLFLSAAALISSRQPVRYYIIGGPIYRSAGSQVRKEELVERAERLGLNGRVGFVGHQTDPSQAFRALDIVVHASTRPEPFGRVIVEGMACGRAVVAMREGGAAELFRDGIDAIGVQPRDPVSLARSIQTLIDDPEKRARLGQAGRASAVSRFDRSRLANRWAAIFDRSRETPAVAVAHPDSTSVASGTLS